MAGMGEGVKNVHGYEFISEKGVYVRRGLDPAEYFVLPDPKKEEESKIETAEEITAVLLLSKFLEPNAEMVVGYLDDAIKGFFPKAKFVAQKTIGWNSLTPLERALYLSDTKTLTGFLEREPGVMTGIGHILSGETLHPDDDPTMCLFVQYGFFPDSLMKREPKHEGKNAFDWYFDNLHNQDLTDKGLGIGWVMQVLTEDGVLLPRNEIETLIWHQTRKSRAVNAPKYPLTNVDEVMDVIYSQYPDVASMGELDDSSGHVISKRALSVAKEFAVWEESDKYFDAIDDLALRSIEEKIGRDDINSKSLLDN